MNDNFYIVRNIKLLIFELNKIIINYPRKEYLLVKRINNNMYDMLELVILFNIDKDIKYLKSAIGKIYMLDSYIEISFKYKYINQNQCNKLTKDLENIRKMLYGVLKNVK